MRLSKPFKLRARAALVGVQYSRLAQLSEAHVLALRAYTSACFKSLNGPLRDQSRTAPHPFPITIYLIADALKKLRGAGGEQAGGRANVALWRGMRDMRATDTFLNEGGSEVAPRAAANQQRCA